MGRIRSAEGDRHKSHLLLDENLHQVDMTTRSRCMQRSPQLIVLRVDIGPMVEEKLDYLFIVVYAALVRKRCRQIVLNFGGRLGLIPGSVVPGYLDMETYFILKCLATSFSNRVKHQIEHKQVKKAPCRTPTLERLKVTGVLQGVMVWGQNQQGIIANTCTAPVLWSSIFKSKHSRNSM